MTYDLASLGWDATFLSAYTRFDRTDHRPGRVARADRGVCTVLTEHGPVRASLAGAMLSASAADLAALPCAGDWVVVRTWPDERITIEAVLPRRAAIVRRTADKDSVGQVLAANLDTAAVVEPIDPAPDLARIERLLALAWESGAQPMVILTKADLAADPAAVAAQVADVAPGVDVVTVSARSELASPAVANEDVTVSARSELASPAVANEDVTVSAGRDRAGRGDDGMAALRPLVAPGRTLALLGRSGAGKSTLVNALAGATVMVTQTIRSADGKGRHTTTYRALVPIPGGGAVLDTPGVRAVGLLDAQTGLDRAFSDVEAFAEACRFADCAHGTEPGCAVREALDCGDLAPRRWQSWRKLQREIAFETRRRDARLAAQERDRWKRIHKEHRVRGGRP
jgi:ribosome biogenesis GTPase